ncbi:right-handed parallel beta-helix repeat-containing protein [Listeria floridensis]|nr:right-handed parallel beta-helix repeat-containing protein [Listeria floridensis]
MITERIEMNLQFNADGFYNEAHAIENVNIWNNTLKNARIQYPSKTLVIALDAKDYYFAGPINLISNLIIQTDDETVSRKHPKAVFHFGRAVGSGNYGAGDANQAAGFEPIKYSADEQAILSEEEKMLNNVTIKSVKLTFITAETESEIQRIGNVSLFINLDHKTVMESSSSLINLAENSTPGYGAYVTGRNIHFSDLDLDGKNVGKNGIECGGINFLRIERCNIRNTGYLNGIGLEYCENVDILSNTIDNVGRSGIQLYRGNVRVYVVGNTVTNWMQRYGVYHLLQVDNNPMFDAAIDSYGPHNFDLTWMDNNVHIKGKVTRDENNQILNTHADRSTDPEPNPCNEILRNILQAKFDAAQAAGGQLSAEMQEKYRLIMKGPHALYQPYRLSGARKVRLENNKALIRSCETYGFLFAATRTVSSELANDGRLFNDLTDEEKETIGRKQVTGFTSDVILKNNEMIIEGEAQFPIRLIAVKKDLYDDLEFPNKWGEIPMRSVASPYATQIGVEFINNSFTLFGRINSKEGYQASGEAQQTATYYINTRATTLRLGNDKVLTNEVSRSGHKVEEVIFHNNTFSFNPPACDTFSRWSYPRFGVVGSPEDTTDEEGKVVDTFVYTQNKYISTADPSEIGDFQEVFGTQIKNPKATLFIGDVTIDYEIGNTLQVKTSSASRVSKVGLYKMILEEDNETLQLIRPDLLVSKLGVSVDENDYFELKDLPEQTEENIRLCALDYYGNIIEARPLKRAVTTIHPIYSNDKFVTGTYDPEKVTQLFLWKNGVYQSQIRATLDSATGAYHFKLNQDHPAAYGELYEVYSRNANGVVVSRKEMLVKPNYELDVGPYEIGQSELVVNNKGHELTHIKLEIKNGNDILTYSPIPINETSLNMMPYMSKINSETELVIWTLDDQYNELISIEVPVLDYQITITTLYDDKYAVGMGSLKGMPGKDLTTIKIYVNGILESEIPADSNQFTFDYNKITAIEDLVEVCGYAGDKLKNRLVLPLSDGYSIDYSGVYRVGTDDTINGLAGTKARFVWLRINGREYGPITRILEGADVQAYGEALPFIFSQANHSLNTLITSESDVVELVSKDHLAVAVNASERRSVRVPLTVAQRDTSLSFDKESFKLGSDNLIKGSMGTSITRVHFMVNGKIAQAVVLDLKNNQITKTDHVKKSINKNLKIVDNLPQGVIVPHPQTFTFEQVDDAITSLQDRVEIIGYDSGIKAWTTIPLTITNGLDEQ